MPRPRLWLVLLAVSVFARQLCVESSNITELILEVGGSLDLKDKPGPGDVRQLEGPALVPAVSAQYKSTGKTQPFTGDMLAPGVLEECAKKRGFNKEIIYSGGDSEKYFVYYFFVLLRWKELGYEHSVLILENENECTKLSSVWDNAGCLYANTTNVPGYKRNVHDRLSMGYRGSEIMLWKFIFLTRMLQLGYNVFWHDIDAYIADEIYKYIKAPQFNEFNVIMSPEYGNMLNTGIWYQHNVDPAGPLPWVSAQVADRTFRFTENVTRFQNRPGTPKRSNVGLFEQGMYEDGMCSAMGGRETFFWSFFPGGARPAKITRWFRLHGALCYKRAEFVRAVYPGDQPGWSVNDATVRNKFNKVWKFGMPRELLPPHAELGGEPYPPRRETSQWLFDFLSAVPGVDYWDPVRDKDKPYSKTQSVMVSPLWLFESYLDMGYQGWWGLKPANVVVGHVHGVEYHAPFWMYNAGMDHMIGKITPMKMFGWWNKEIDKLLIRMGKNVHCPGCVVSQVLKGLSQPKSRPLVLYAPSLRVDGSSKVEIQSKFQGLVLLGSLSGHLVAWPRVACTSKALDRNPDKRWVLRLSDDHVVPAMQDGSHDLKNAVCTWWPTMTYQCQKVGMHFGDMDFMVSDGACKQPVSLSSFCTAPFPETAATFVATLDAALQEMKGKECVHIPCIPAFGKALEALSDVDKRPSEKDDAVVSWLKRHEAGYSRYKTRMNSCPLYYPKKTQA